MAWEFGSTWQIAQLAGIARQSVPCAPIRALDKTQRTSMGVGAAGIRSTQLFPGKSLPGSLSLPGCRAHEPGQDGCAPASPRGLLVSTGDWSVDMPGTLDSGPTCAVARRPASFAHPHVPRNRSVEITQSEKSDPKSSLVSVPRIVPVKVKRSSTASPSQVSVVQASAAYAPFGG